ncbi:hypothetical protein LNP27_14085 [Flavobacterium galactosidilyticum]|uniref:hypothetical protein n=1 Tax=Flavobacterium galactosidilyticum TaxID=2893886 RepID=UPI001E5496BC|nr:hypothetical protein [Flavobacterium sp. F-340]UFH46239.1 hypothetical protein LNP27_14085 [Flavobacterium sp. F-340]
MKTRTLLFLALLTISCVNKQADKVDFLVTENNVGVFKKGMTVKEVLDIVPKVHIKKVVDKDDYENSYDDYQYFDTNKIHLLTLTPTVQDEIQSKINRILILDNRFKTNKNIGLGSTYADLKNNHKITDIAPDLEHIVLTVGELNARFSINKKQLLDNWWDESKKQIDISKIPDTATLDTFVIWWK